MDYFFLEDIFRLLIEVLAGAIIQVDDFPEFEKLLNSYFWKTLLIFKKVLVDAFVQINIQKLKLALKYLTITFKFFNCVIIHFQVSHFDLKIVLTRYMFV